MELYLPFSSLFFTSVNLGSHVHVSIGLFDDHEEIGMVAGL